MSAGKPDNNGQHVPDGHGQYSHVGGPDGAGPDGYQHVSGTAFVVFFFYCFFFNGSLSCYLAAILVYLILILRARLEKLT